MKTNDELKAALNMILARIESEPKTAAEWTVILDHLRQSASYAEKTTLIHQSIEARSEFTDAERRLIEKLQAKAGRTAHIRGPEVRTARRLEARGVVKLHDDGKMIDAWGQVDGEQWSAELIDVRRAS